MLEFFHLTGADVFELMEYEFVPFDGYRLRFMRAGFLTCPLLKSTWNPPGKGNKIGPGPSLGPGPGPARPLGIKIANFVGNKQISILLWSEHIEEMRMLAGVVCLC